MSPDRPIPQDQMLPAEEMNRLLDPGNFETEIGWGMMDNGAGYIAMRHEMPGVTVDMVDWWFAWHPIEGLRYRIWYPPYHLGVHVDDWAQPRLLDPAVPGARQVREGRPPRHRRHGRWAPSTSTSTSSRRSRWAST